MKKIVLERATLDGCVNEAQRERVVITRKGKPVALIVGVAGMDEEQVELGGSKKFWTLIEARRKQRTISRAELEGKISKRTPQRSVMKTHA
jgi:antitoxin (DNA-binding transcriptional repressor) of toxin-antitoxin stability system